MADTFSFSLVSPERELVNQQVEMVVVPGSEGDFGVLKGHAPVVSRLRPGLVCVTADGEEKRYFVYHGFAEVTGESLSVLAEDASPVDELEATGLDQRIQDASEDVSVAKDAFDKALAEENLNHLQAVKAAIAAS
jgi:F-type H+-transporting ATPase subunit epsilon